MSQQLPSISAREHTVHLENIVLRLLTFTPEQMRPASAAWPFSLHDHVATELFTCAGGEMTLKTESGYLTLHSDDAAVIPPGLPHITLHVAPGSNCHAISFLIRPRNVRDCMDLQPLFAPIAEGKQVLVFRHRPELIQGVHALLQEQNPPFAFLPAMHLAELLLHALSSGWETDSVTDSVPETVPHFNDLQRIVELDSLIEKYYKVDCKMEDIAASLFISCRQLDRIVRKRYGKTLHQLFMDKRILAAEQLLLATDMNIDKIAITVGFHTSSGFYREFIRRRGISPTQYRKQNGLPFL